MTQGLYLGKEYDPATKALGDKVELDPADLLTHGLIVGMTGSGKTGLAIALIEEVLRQGIPVLAIDPRATSATSCCCFPSLSKEEFAPWIDEESREARGADQGPGRGGSGRHLDQGPRRLGPRQGRRRQAQGEPRGHHLHARLDRGRAAEHPPVARRAGDAVRRRSGRPARRDRRHRHRHARPAEDRGRSAAVAGVHPSLEHHRGRLAQGPGPEPRGAHPRRGRSALRQARRAAARDRLPAQGPPGADDRPQQPARRAQLRGVAQRRAARHGADAGRRQDRACRSSTPRTSPTRSACS